MFYLRCFDIFLQYQFADLINECQSLGFNTRAQYIHLIYTQKNTHRCIFSLKMHVNMSVCQLKRCPFYLLSQSLLIKHIFERVNIAAMSFNYSFPPLVYFEIYYSGSKLIIIIIKKDRLGCTASRFQCVGWTKRYQSWFQQMHLLSFCIPCSYITHIRCFRYTFYIQSVRKINEFGFGFYKYKSQRHFSYKKPTQLSICWLSQGDVRLCL